MLGIGKTSTPLWTSRTWMLMASRLKRWIEQPGTGRPRSVLDRGSGGREPLLLSRESSTVRLVLVAHAYGDLRARADCRASDSAEMEHGHRVGRHLSLS